MTETTQRIIVIDDDLVTRTILGKMLSKAGFEAEVFSSVEEAILSARNAPPDAALVDIGLPGGLSGFDFVTLLRREPKLASLPVLMITATSGKARVMRSIEVGACDFIVKPLVPKTVIEKVRRALAKSESGEFTARSEKAASPASGEVDPARRSSGSHRARRRVFKTEMRGSVLLATLAPGAALEGQEVIKAAAQDLRAASSEAIGIVLDLSDALRGQVEASDVGFLVQALREDVPVVRLVSGDPRLRKEVLRLRIPAGVYDDLGEAMESI